MTPTDLVFIFATLTSLGAALGAVGITMGELFYTRAAADGKIETCEKEYIRATFWTLRYGMSLVLISSIAQIVTQYFAIDAPQDVLTPAFWFSLISALCVIFAGWGIARNRIPWWLGSAIGFTGWWTIFVLTAWRNLPYSFFTLLITFVIGTAVVAGLFSAIRSLAMHGHANPSS